MCNLIRDLPGVQQELIEALHATGTPLVVVIMSGRPLTIPWLAEHVPAIVQAWHPGIQGGNALADIWARTTGTGFSSSASGGAS